MVGKFVLYRQYKFYHHQLIDRMLLDGIAVRLKDGLMYIITVDWSNCQSKLFEATAFIIFVSMTILWPATYIINYDCYQMKSIGKHSELHSPFSFSFSSVHTKFVRTYLAGSIQKQQFIL